MDSFDINGIEDDNHICIRCKQTINGLENYIEHRKRLLCKHMTADQFFNCLQLQHKHKSIEDNFDNDCDNEEEEDSRNVINNSLNDSDEEQSEEDIDIYRPPNDFTGGKWKPGCGPQLINTSNRTIDYLTDYSSDNSELLVEINRKKIRNSEESVKKFEDLYPKRTQSIFNLQSINSSNDSIDKSNNDFDINRAKRKVSDNYFNYNNDIINEEVIVSNDGNEKNNTTLKCIVCNFRANNLSVLLKHYLNTDSHTDNDVVNDLIVENELILMRSLSFVCEMCCFYTNKSNNYFWHITTQLHSQNAKSQKPSFLCKICDQKCDNIEKLIEHLKNKQSIHANSFGPIIVCEPIIKHNYNQSIESVAKDFDCFKCDFCGQTFKFKTHLKKHTISQHLKNVAFPDLIKSNFIGDKAKYSCLKCDFKTDSEGTHLLHSINHELPINLNNADSNEKTSNNLLSVKRNEYKYKCPVCDNHYICRELKKHINKHIDEKPYDCFQCDKKFTKISYLRNHEKTHNGIRDQICEICGSSFVLFKQLKRHLKIHNTNRERSLACDVCGATFFSKYILMSHMKRHLPKYERQYKCQFQGCRYAFVQKNELIEHQRVHSNPEEKPYLCDRCPYKTKSVFTFRKHYRQHTGYKPFKCNLCEYTTTLSSNLCRHSRIHTGVKPYKCPYCSYECNTQENVRKHILKTKKHSGLYVYPCKHCDYKTNVFNHYRKHIAETHSQLYTETQIDSLVSNLFQTNSTNI